MKKRQQVNIRVNMCWEVDGEKKCVTLNKDEAYATKKWVEERNGSVWWFQGLPD